MKEHNKMAIMGVLDVGDLAAKVATENKFPKAEKYDAYLRDPNTVEVIGYVPDPTYDIKDFVGREMLFPKRWVTIGVITV